MVRYIIKRVLLMIPILIGVTFLVFVLLSLTPGDIARVALGSNATEEQLELFREQNGLNDPLVVQYVNYMIGVLQGDFGMSYISHQEVSTLISTRIGKTLTLSFISMAITFLCSLPLGIAMAVKQNSAFDNVTRVFSIIFSSMPDFWLGIMMILLFSVSLGWLPSSGLDSVAAGIMPVVTLALGGITLCSRTGRSSMLEVLHQDYIRTAKAKGLSKGYILRHHALKNSMLPLISVYGRIIATCFSGTVVVESVFGISGIGNLMTTSIRQKDVTTVMACIIISACIITVVNLLVDLMYAVVDPRIKSRYSVKKKKKRVKEVAHE